MKSAVPLTLAFGIAGCLVTPRVQAFQGQWHLGAGIGMMSYRGDSTVSMPSLALHGAYGLNDMFDARLELGESVPLSSGDSSRSLGYAEGILAYKLDVIEWIPWAGLGVGAFAASGGLQGASREPVQPAASVWFGLDYAFAREWGFGAFLALHSWVADSTRSTPRYAATNFGIRFERRFGW
jgi:hypothetical protein